MYLVRVIKDKELQSIIASKLELIELLKKDLQLVDVVWIENGYYAQDILEEKPEGLEFGEIGDETTSYDLKGVLPD
jgi:hypothetical protein